MKTIDRSLLDEVAHRLANELHPAGIWLFGSHEVSVLMEESTEYAMKSKLRMLGQCSHPQKPA